MTNKKPSNYYITSDELFEEYNKSLEGGFCTDKLLSYFQKIAKRFSTKFHSTNLIDKEAVINYAVTEAWLKWNMFDPKKSSNIFSFYTTMIANDMRLHYKSITKGKNVNISIESLFEPKD